jgi:hypothetical protein
MEKKKGFINKIFPERGYMFVHEPIPGAVTKSYFLHVRNVISGEPMLGRVVHFSVGHGPKGIYAYDAEVIDPEIITSDAGIAALAAPQKIGGAE